MALNRVEPVNTEQGRSKQIKGNEEEKSQENQQQTEHVLSWLTEQKSWFVTQSEKHEMRISTLALNCVANHRLCGKMQEML